MTTLWFWVPVGLTESPAEAAAAEGPGQAGAAGPRNCPDDCPADASGDAQPARGLCCAPHHLPPEPVCFFSGVILTSLSRRTIRWLSLPLGWQLVNVSQCPLPSEPSCPTTLKSLGRTPQGFEWPANGAITW